MFSFLRPTCNFYSWDFSVKISELFYVAILMRETPRQFSEVDLKKKRARFQTFPFQKCQGRSNSYEKPHFMSRVTRCSHSFRCARYCERLNFLQNFYLKRIHLFYCCQILLTCYEIKKCERLQMIVYVAVMKRWLPNLLFIQVFLTMGKLDLVAFSMNNNKWCSLPTL